jgi:hypothetical protein
MSEWQPVNEWQPGYESTDLAAAVRQRERSRSRIRLVTATVGAASLVTAGVVAYSLPGSAHTTTTKVATTPSAQPSASQQTGDDGTGDDGNSAVTVPSGTSAQAPAHSTSGGS